LSGTIPYIIYLAIILPAMSDENVLQQ